VVVFTKQLPKQKVTIPSPPYVSVAKGAKNLVGESHFQAATVGTAFVGPQVLVDVDHTMDVMMEEVRGCLVCCCLESSHA
jgi:hypothetical protein